MISIKKTAAIFGMAGLASSVIAAGAAVSGEPFLVKKSALAGKDIPVLPVSWPKDMVKSGIKQHRNLDIYSGQLTASVYEADDGVIEMKDQPYDEVVHVLHGEATLTSVGGTPHRFVSGDVFVVPKGFTGTWAMNDHYREFIVVETKAFNGALAKWFPQAQ
jgi:uncharacterized cupin superfamily protein